jgi:hypothetical protein
MRASKRAGDLVFVLHLPRYIDLSSRLKKTGRIFVGGVRCAHRGTWGTGNAPHVLQDSQDLGFLWLIVRGYMKTFQFGRDLSDVSLPRIQWRRYTRNIRVLALRWNCLYLMRSM